MDLLLKIIHVMAALLLVLVVLLQSGRGGGVGAGLGGASGQIFGGRGAAPFLIKLTTSIAAVFFVTSMSLSAISSHRRSVMLQTRADTEPSLHAQSAEPAAPTEADEAMGDDSLKAPAPTGAQEADRPEPPAPAAPATP